MKQLTCSLILAAIASCALTPLSAQDARPADKKSAYEFEQKMRNTVIPEISRPVNDYAEVISPAQENRIADMIVAHNKKTGIQMAVLTVRTTGGMNIEEFSLKTAEQWGGGSKERDDGLLFTVAVFDRRMRIEVGYGLEGYITDLRAGRILDGIREDFRSSNYGPGIEKAVAEMIRSTDEVRPGQEPPASVRFRGALSHVVDCYAAFFILGGALAVLLILGRMRLKLAIWMTVAAGLLLFIAVPVLFQLFFHGAWYWTPVLYLMGAFAGAMFMVAMTVPRTKKMKIVATAVIAVPVLVSLVSIIYFLQIQKPVQVGTSKNETMLLGILIATNIIQFFIMPFLGEGSSGGSSYSGGSGDSGSSSSGSSSSSSSSNDSSWSGGGGSYGGGGASSSW